MHVTSMFDVPIWSQDEWEMGKEGPTGTKLQLGKVSSGVYQGDYG